MKTNANAALSAAKVARQAKTDVKNAKQNPLFILHLLNKIAKGAKESDVAKSEALKELQKRCGCGAKGFTFQELKVNGSGQICRLRKYAGAYTRNAVSRNYLGAFEWVPVPCTEAGIISALQSVAAYRDAVQKDLSTPKKRTYSKHELFSMLKAGKIDEATFVELFEAAA